MKSTVNPRYLLTLQKKFRRERKFPPNFLIPHFRSEIKTADSKDMIEKSKLEEFIVTELEGTEYFLVDLHVEPDNSIKVVIDSDGVADLEKCVSLTHAIEQAFDRNEEDYELEVGTAGLTSPLKTTRQFRKYLGNEVEVLATDGKKHTGLLKEVTDDGFTIVEKVKEKPEGAKRPVVVEKELRLTYPEAKKVTYLIKF